MSLGAFVRPVLYQRSHPSFQRQGSPLVMRTKVERDKRCCGENVEANHATWVFNEEIVWYLSSGLLLSLPCTVATMAPWSLVENSRGFGKYPKEADSHPHDRNQQNRT